MDGFLLLGSEGVDILRDNDLVLLQVRWRRCGARARTPPRRCADAASGRHAAPQRCRQPAPPAAHALQSASAALQQQASLPSGTPAGAGIKRALQQGGRARWLSRGS
jgi:hypothetical protein